MLVNPVMTAQNAPSANRTRRKLLFSLLAGGPCLYPSVPAETLARFRDYISSQEVRLIAQTRSAKDFLWTAQDPARLQSVRGGEIIVEQLTPPEIPGGMIQHWIGGVFVPGVDLAQVKRLDQDYNRYKDLYGPDIQDSKLLSRHGDHFQVFYRFKKQKVLTVVLDTVHEIDFTAPAPHRLSVISRCDHVREVKNPGSPQEQVLPEGEGGGFLWAMNSYWRMEEGKDGVHLECEAITLARSIPFGMTGLVGPIVNSFAADSLRNSLTAKRRAIQQTRPERGA